MRHMARQLLSLTLDVLLGPPCLVCGQRVRGTWLSTHSAIQHPGEAPSWR